MWLSLRSISSSRQVSAALYIRAVETHSDHEPLGIFMGLSVSIVLFLILYVGVTAVAGLEVSYFAFSKEMGPTAQKKQQ